MTETEGRTEGVVIPEHIAKASDDKKKKRRKTLAQLPVYRASANLMYVLFSLMLTAPRKATKFLDLMLESSDRLMYLIGMADKARTTGEREVYIDEADVIARNLSRNLSMLRHIKVSGHCMDGDRMRTLPVVSKTDEDKMCALIRSITSQLVAWMSYIRKEGVDSRLVQ